MAGNHKPRSGTVLYWGFTGSGVMVAEAGCLYSVLILLIGGTIPYASVSPGWGGVQHSPLRQLRRRLMERGLGRACRCTALESFTQHILWSFKGLSRGRGDTGFL